MTRLVTYVNGRKEATNGETLTNGHPSKTQPELNGRTTSKIDAVAPALTALRNSADEVLRLLQDEDVSPLLYKMLHDPDQLPDKKLSGLCSEVVDSLERVSLEITPSVSILSDGFFSYLQSKALWTVVQAQVPDVLHSQGAQTAKQLGLRCDIQPERLAQLMDTLINWGIFASTRNADGTILFNNNRVSDLLRRDHWTQWHLWTDLYGNDFYNVARSMPAAVKIGEARSAAQIEYGTEMDLFEYLAKEGLMEKFHKTLGAGAIAQAKGLAVDYPFQEVEGETLIDIGGGSGAFLVELLRTYPNLKGNMLDISSVIDNVTSAFRSPDGKFADVGDRVPDLIKGNFLEAVPASSVYTMKWCLHDWMDEDVVTVFKNVRRSIVESPVSRFLVFESVKEPGRSSRLPRHGDLIMMITVNGKERSREDWHRLAAAGGWRVESITPIRRAWPCAIDLRPV